MNESCPLGYRGRLDTEIRAEMACGYGDANVSKRDWFLGTDNKVQHRRFYGR